jgi:hypothetical protein
MRAGSTAKSEHGTVAAIVGRGNAGCERRPGRRPDPHGDLAVAVDVNVACGADPVARGRHGKSAFRTDTGKD